jgi:hypothetical protein
MNPNEEKLLRENIRSLIKFVKEKKQLEEQKTKDAFRELVALELRSLLNERSVPDVNPTPNKSTGINVLEDLLKKIVPQLEMDYKQLTTSPEQRESFRAHMVNAVVKTLSPVEANDRAGDAAAAEDEINEQDIEVEIGDELDPEQDKFIDIRTDAEKKAEEEDEEIDPRDDFADGIEGENDETGRNMAYNTFNKIDTSIIDSYQLLSNEEDQEIFYDYLIANMKLYFDKFESEMTPEVDEPSNQAYDTAKQDTSAEMGVEDELDIDLG